VKMSQVWSHKFDVWFSVHRGCAVFTCKPGHIISNISCYFILIIMILSQLDRCNAAELAETSS
jgi:hypothetical protein